MIKLGKKDEEGIGNSRWNHQIMINNKTIPMRI